METCIDCQRPRAPNRSCCEHHLAKRREYTRRYLDKFPERRIKHNAKTLEIQRRHRANGLCATGCGTPTGGKSVCPPCRAKQIPHNRARRAARKEAGLCLDCKTPAISANHCAIHEERKKAQRWQWGKHNPAPPAVRRCLDRRIQRAEESGLPVFPSVVLALIARGDGKCFFCAAREATSADHLIPLSRGGQHTRENLAAVCLPCQQSKGGKTTDEFIQQFHVSKSYRSLKALNPAYM